MTAMATATATMMVIAATTSTTAAVAAAATMTTTVTAADEDDSGSDDGCGDGCAVTIAIAVAAFFRVIISLHCCHTPLVSIDGWPCLAGIIVLVSHACADSIIPTLSLPCLCPSLLRHVVLALSVPAPLLHPPHLADPIAAKDYH